MAIIYPNGLIKGTAGSVVFRTYRDKNIMQGQRTKNHFTAASIISSGEFGLISSASRCIRNVLEPAYHVGDGRIGGRVVSAVSRSIRYKAGTIAGKRDLHDGDLQELIGLEFNTNSPLSNVFQVKAEVSRNEGQPLQIHMPALEIKKALKIPRPLVGKGYKVRIGFLLTAFNFRENFYEYVDHQELEYTIGESYEGLTLTMSKEPPQGCIMLLSMSVNLYEINFLEGGRVLLNNKEFSPCAIIDAWHTGEAIPLKEAHPVNVSRTAKSSMSYDGNRLLAELPERIRKNPYKSSSGPGKKSPTKAKTGDVEVNLVRKKVPELVLGKKMKL